MAKKLNCFKELSDSYNFLGVIAWYDNDFNKSIEFYKKSLNTLDTNLNKKEVSNNLSNIGLAFFKLSVFDSALIYNNKALKLRREVENHKGAANILINNGTIYYYQGNFEKSIQYFLEAVKAFEIIYDSVGMSNSLNNIGAIYVEIEEFEKAIPYFNKSIKIDKEIDENSDLSYGYGNIANVHLKLKDYNKALEYFNLTIEVAKKHNNTTNLSESYNGIGNSYKELGETKKAIKYYMLANKINSELNNKYALAINYISLCELYLQIPQSNDKAIFYANNALNIAKEIGAMSTQVKAYDVLYRAFKTENDYKKALYYHELFTQLNDSIFNSEKYEAIAEMQTRYETEKKEKQIIQQLAELKTIQLETEKEKAEKERQKLQRNMFIIAFGLMIILVAIILRSYRHKKMANILLTQQKHKIAEANEELNQQNEEITVQRDELEDQKNIVEKVNQKISHSIDYAKRIQQSVLPDQAVLTKYLADHFVLFEPKDKVSGDFYWWSYINNHTIITAVDCTGHGVPGAFMSMLGGSFLRDIVQKEGITNTGEILQKLRNEVIKALKQKGEIGEQKDGMEMAIISIHHETNVMQFSGANNPVYIIPNNARKIEGFEDLDGLYELKPDKMPISIYHKMSNFTTNEIQLEKGDQLYLFSDGYADQFGRLTGKRFNYQSFKKVLLKNKNRPMIEQKEFLKKTFDDWKGNTEQIDDVVVVGVKI